MEFVQVDDSGKAEIILIKGFFLTLKYSDQEEKINSWLKKIK